MSCPQTADNLVTQGGCCPELGQGFGKQSVNVPQVAKGVAETFTQLLDDGFWPIAVYPPGIMLPNRSKPTEGKEPIGARWGLERWTYDRWCDVRTVNPTSGLGLCLGPERGPGGTWLIDVEGDGPEAEESRSKLFGGEVIETTGWKSARGVHQLFVADVARLAEIVPGLKALEQKGATGTGVYKSSDLPGLELRIGGYKDDRTVKQIQSVVPPTLATNRLPREWNGSKVVAAVPDAFYASLAALVGSKQAESTPKPPAPPVASPSGREWSIENRAIAYIGKCEPAISGQKGHDQAFKTVCKVGPGFDLSPDQAFRLLWDHYNPGCEPQWSEQELRHKIEDAYQKETRRGWFLERVIPLKRVGVVGRPRLNVLKIDEESADETQNARPSILISTDEFRVNNEAVAALALDPEVFCRGPYLVSIQRDQASNKLITRPPNSPCIGTLSKSVVRERLSKNADWHKDRWNVGKQKYEPTLTHPPDWSVGAIVARGGWPEIRPLEGITECPVLRPDGTVIELAGYDEATGLHYEPNCEFAKLPDQISRADAKQAAELLLGVVSDFPFAVTGEGIGDGGAAHKAAFLAGT